MDKELYIDGELVDLGKDSIIAITKQVNDVGNVETRNGDLSNEFRLPFTNVNDKQFEVIKLVQSESSKAYRKLPAKFIDAGVEIIGNGFAIIESADENYNVTVYNGNSYFFDLIKGKKMRDLPLSDLDHIWDKATIIASRLNDSGYIYGVADYNERIVTANTPQTIYTDAIYTMLYCHTLLERIVTSLPGWTFEPGDLLEDELYMTLLYAFSNEVFKNSDRESESTVELGSPVQSFHMETTFDSPPDTGWTVNNSGYAGTGTLNGSPANFFTPMASPFFEWTPDGNFTTDSWVAPITAKIKFKFDAQFTATKQLYGGDPFNFQYFPYVIIWNETTNTYLTPVQLALPNYYIPKSTPLTTQHEVHIQTTGVDVQAGDIIRVFTWVQIFGQPDYEFDFSVDDVFFQIEYENEIIVGSTVNVSQQLPDMTQSDFFKSMMNIFCAIPDSDSSTQTVKLRSFNELKQNIHRAKDWSEKVSGNKTRITYRNNNYFQQNDFIWQHDFGVTAFLGDGSFDIDDENLEPRGTVVESPFGASIESLQDVIQQGGNILSVPAINNASSSGGKISPRLLVLRRQDVADGIKYNDGSDTTITTDLPLCHFILDGYVGLDWNDLLVAYWEAIIEMLDKTKIIVEKIDLKSIDCAQGFDHFVPVYIEKHAAYFYVNKIVDFQRGKLTDVELIRL